jgi:hypothetical protein
MNATCGQMFILPTAAKVTVPPAEPGACILEPLKAVKKLEPLKRLSKQLQLIFFLVSRVLVFDVDLDHFFISSYR